MAGFNTNDQGFYSSGYGWDESGWNQQDPQQCQQQGQQQQQQQQGQPTQYDYYGGQTADSQQQYAGDMYNQGQYGQPDYSAGYADSGFAAPPQPQPYTGSIFTPAPLKDSFDQQSGTNFDDEPPLLEELGINFDHIIKKTRAVLNPFAQPDPAILDDTDLAGPLVFCLMFGASLLLVGKVHFGYIYGIGGMGCVSMYCLLNLMSMSGVNLECIMSVLGYCLLPMALLSTGSVVISLQTIAGNILALLTISWCAASASKLFVTALGMQNMQLLVAYPCALLYGVFALLTVF